MCALGDFLVLSAPVLCQIARYLPHHRSENASKTHPKSAHDNSKQLLNPRKSALICVSISGMEIVNYQFLCGELEFASCASASEVSSSETSSAEASASMSSSASEERTA